MTTTADPTPVQGAEAAKPPFAPAVVEELLRQFTKTIRTHQLYLPNNPIYQRAIETLRGAFDAVWKETGELVLEVTDSEFRWVGVTVMRDTSRAESLPWLFFKDGIRELRFLKGFEGDELILLLDILRRVKNASPEEDDLLTMLWEQEFLAFRYRFVDIAMNELPPLEASELPETEEAMPSVREDVKEEPEKQNSIVRMEDFDPTVHFLDEHEMAYLRREIQSEYEADLPRNVIAMLLDIFEIEASERVREEICEILDGLILHLLAGGQYGVVAYLLREARTAAERAAEATPQHRERLSHLPERLSQPAVLPKLLQALDEADSIPPREDLDALFEQLGPATLGTVFAWMARAQNAELRATLEAVATRLASAHVGELIKLIASSEDEVAMEAMRRAAVLKSAAAVTQLGVVLGTAPAHLRQGAARALMEIGSPGALRALESAVEDDDREVRLIAVRALSGAGHRGALERLAQVVDGKAMRDCDLTEKMVLFEAYGALAGDEGVDRLDKLLNIKGFFTRRPDVETRACAAMALGKIGSARALAALGRASNEKDVLVRNAINKALRGGRE